MASACLYNERNRTELKKCQVALEAQARGEDQPKDLKYSQLQNTFNEHKYKQSHVIIGYVKEKQKPEKKQKALDALKGKLEAVHEELATDSAQRGSKRSRNSRILSPLVRLIKHYQNHQLKIMHIHKTILAARKMLKKSHTTLIARVHALTDNFHPKTGRLLFDAAGTLQ